MKLIAAFLVFAILTGCQSNKPKRIEQINFAPAERSRDQAKAAAVAAVKHNKEARASNDVTRGSIGRAKQSADYETKGLHELQERAVTIFRNAPLELKEEAEKLQAKVAEVQKLHAEETIPALFAAEQAAEETNKKVNLVGEVAETANLRLDDLGKQLIEAKVAGGKATADGNRNYEMATEAQVAQAKAEKRAVLGWVTAGALTLGIVSFIVFKLYF